MMEIISWILVGMLLGIVARLLLRIKDPDGILVTLLLGIAGSLLGGFLSVAMGLVDFGQRAALVPALVGAVAALALKAWAVRYESNHG
jgi:uncharacterized membrane protein YeaQ/YmgE (transglycosylase-associated protein family)